MKQFLLLFPLLFLAGKPYYMFWLQVLMVFELGKIELSSDRWIRFSGLALALLWVYLTVIFPFAETRILNPEYPENYNQGLTLRKQMKVPTFCTPALAVPFLSKPHPTRLVVSYGIPGKIYNSAIGSTALSSELLKGEVPYQECFGPFLFIRYHAWLLPADTISYGLFMYGAER
jgi:hypothetical protein